MHTMLTTIAHHNTAHSNSINSNYIFLAIVVVIMAAIGIYLWRENAS